MGKSGLLENSVFWRRRGARNPCRLKKCGWGAGCGGGHWGWSSESENQEHFVLYLVCSDKQLGTQGGPAWLSTSWSSQAGEAPPPLVPTAPGTHQPSALFRFHFTAGLHVCSPWDSGSLRKECLLILHTIPLTKFLSHDKAGQHTSFRPKYPEHLLPSADRTLGQAQIP